MGSGLSGLWAMTGFRAGRELLLAGQALGARLGEQLAMFVMMVATTTTMMLMVKSEKNRKNKMMMTMTALMLMMLMRIML